jgi:hypothetical protein
MGRKEKGQHEREKSVSRPIDEEETRGGVRGE